MTTSPVAAVSGDRFEQRVRGVCPVVEVPFRGDESVDEDSFARLADHVAGTGITSVMFPGFASEFHKLTEAERAALLAILIERTAGRTPDSGRPASGRTESGVGPADGQATGGIAVVAGVADDATAVAVASAERAVACGAAAINLLPPFRVTPSPAELRRHIETVSAAIAPTPLILQHAPALTGVPIDAPAIAAIARRVPNLRMVKVEAVPPGAFISALRRTDPALPAMVGYGGVMLPDALRRGAVGVQPGCSFVEVYVRIWDLWHAGQQQRAEALHRRALPYLAYWMQSVDLIVAAEKAISARRGLIATEICRHPRRELDEQERHDIDRFMTEFADLLGI